MARLSAISNALFLLAIAATTSSPVFVMAQQSSDNACDVDTYYESLGNSNNPSSWTKTALAKLVTDTQSTILPIVADVNGDDDVYQALIDLWPGDTENTTVHLLYRDISFAAVPYDNTNTWTRADLWPLGRGIPRTTAGHTDVHTKAPGDATVLNLQGDLMFGECGTVESALVCQQPPEVASDCQTDGKIWLPPQSVRGDIARALMFAQLRYERALNLELVDCPPFLQGQFGYLSALLQWHQDDPVDAAELARNNRICSRWQGNRNPFIDYPELAAQYYGEPDTIMEGTLIYSQCVDSTTSAPTASPNDCSGLEPGDIQILLENSDDPDQIALFSLDIIPFGVRQIYVTDMPWDGTKFLDNGEGTIVIDVPESSIGGDNATYSGWAPGSIFGYGFNADDGAFRPFGNGDFNLNEDGKGDTILTYCLNADGLPHFLNGFSFAGDWATAGMTADEYGEAKSSLPTQLAEQGSVALPVFKNYNYAGPTNAFKRDLVAAYGNASNYNGTNTVRVTVPLLESGAMSSAALMLASCFGLVVAFLLL